MNLDEATAHFYATLEPVRAAMPAEAVHALCEAGVTIPVVFAPGVIVGGPPEEQDPDERLMAEYLAEKHAEVSDGVMFANPPKPRTVDWESMTAEEAYAAIAAAPGVLNAWEGGDAWSVRRDIPRGTTRASVHPWVGEFRAIVVAAKITDACFQTMEEAKAAADAALIAEGFKLCGGPR